MKPKGAQLNMYNARVSFQTKIKIVFPPHPSCYLFLSDSMIHAT